MSRSWSGAASGLPIGLVFEIAERAALKPRGSGDKRIVCCPFHEDANASAFLAGSNNVFFCAVCTPDGGWSAKRFATELGLNWDECLHGVGAATPRVPPRSTQPEFTAADAQQVWAAAFKCARDDNQIERHRHAYDYLARRGLLEAVELGVFGLISAESPLHPAISSWPSRGYAIIAPLFDQHGRVSSIQARAITDCTPKTMFPTGSRVSGTVFADRRGASLLRADNASSDTVIYGEGLTDMLALSIASPFPVLTAPGTSCAVAGVGDWARDREVLLALDCDPAGETALGPVAEKLYAAGARAVRRIQWPPGAKDACDVVRARRSVGLEEFLQKLKSAA